MNCRESRQLISAYMDGELKAQEMEAVKLHLENCALCRQAYEELLQAGHLLKLMSRDIIPAPPGFKEAVMQRVKEEAAARPSWKKTVFSRPGWKVFAATAAAVAVLALASTGSDFFSGPHIAENPPPVVDKEPGVQTADPGTDINRNTDIDNDNPGETGGNNGKPGDNPAVIIPGDSPAESPDSPALQAVLLSEEQRCLLSTMIRLKAGEHCASPLPNALKIAGDMGATTEVLSQQVVDGVDCSQVKMVIGRDKAENLIIKLSSLGTVTKREDNSEDISKSYEQLIAQHGNLSKQLQEAKDEQEKTQLQGQLNELNRQLKDWKQKAGEQVIVVELQG